MSESVHKFRIYPEKDRFRYYTVFVFPSKRAMYTYFREQRGILDRVDGTDRCNGECNFQALATGWTVCNYGPDKTETINERDIGQILCHQGRIGAGLISHEMTHAALFWAAREKLNPKRVVCGEGNRAEHERFCTVQGNLVRQFWLRWWKLEKK
jgi:hypothetical protein